MPRFVIRADEADETSRAAPRWAMLTEKKFGYLIGIDEVGRGSLAGPVVVAAVCIPAGVKFGTGNLKLGKLRDSKKLSRRRREAWRAYFEFHPQIHYALACVRPATIDRINISRAANLAALRAFRKLIGRIGLLQKCTAFLDGGLYLGSKKTSVESYGAHTVVRGDEKIPAVTIASIIAKVARDKGMKRISNKFPGFGFEFHSGYGTKRHIAAIKKLGPSPIHRLTFLGKIKV